QAGDSAGEGGDSAAQQMEDGDRMMDWRGQEEAGRISRPIRQEESRLRKELEKIKEIYNEMFNGGIPTAKYFAKMIISFSEHAVSKAAWRRKLLKQLGRKLKSISESISHT
ncbi:hypothetical protein HK098_006950, partial [Nowakowskiella sp. JEL0407]